ncbi:unnamed protein product [Rotaria sordida]|uniref:MATH domain-containing protein n=1 Tax=Rotaria sordida TaxID=392033 RepID=A0A814T8S9_9BILA|nr:unnamed protein product [Rotaria sordida]CAF1404415.1 unnamed protein product [Rotaria sordida]
MIDQSLVLFPTIITTNRETNENLQQLYETTNILLNEPCRICNLILRDPVQLKCGHRQSDAQSERQTSIYSPPFHSSQSGYKMRARLYLNGDGNARRTHISLFFILMRSEYDAILRFPFNYKVTFCLYDQTPTEQHIIDSFQPDIKSNSFQHPRSEMNIASGIPKLCPLSTIQ